MAKPMNLLKFYWKLTPEERTLLRALWEEENEPVANLMFVSRTKMVKTLRAWYAIGSRMHISDFGVRDILRKLEVPVPRLKPDPSGQSERWYNNPKAALEHTFGN